jgi:chemotaxis protein MotB
MDFEDDNDGEGWLVSYADMMTLIASFFILMMAFANYDPPGFQKKAEVIAKHFRKDKNKSSAVKLKFLDEEIAIHPELKNKIKISVKDGELVLVFSGSTIFDNGEFKLDKDTVKTVDSLIDIIKTTNPQYRILVEGHADDSFEVESKKNTVNSNWLISSLRAASIIERFSYFGFPPSNLAALAKGDTQKILPSIDKNGERIERNAAINRRAIIKVLEPLTKKKVKLGLGIYFQDSVEDTKENIPELEDADSLIKQD